jgi:tetratricopeptide (TPR) repeat protein
MIEAARLAAEALETTPDDLQLNLLAGRALTDAGEYERARPYLGRVISLDQESAWPTAWARVCFAQALYTKGDLDGTRQELLQALQCRPAKVASRRAAALLSKVGGHSAFYEWRSLETELLRIHIPPDSQIDNLQRYSREKEADLAQLQKFFQVKLPGKIDVFVWNDHADSEPAMYRSLGFAYPSYLLVHTRLRQTPGHELAHVICHYAAKPMRQSRFIDEGTAVRFDLTGRDRMAVARRVIREENLRPFSIVKMWETADSIPEATLYPLAGAFVDRLIKQGGRDKYMSLLLCPTVEHAHAVYGAEFTEIVAEFERELTTERQSHGNGN